MNLDDQDGNNGCGNDLDREDDNNGNCGGPGVEPQVGGGDGGGAKIAICHATGSDTNPFVYIEISVNGLNGHFRDGHQEGEDIIGVAQGSSCASSTTPPPPPGPTPPPPPGPTPPPSPGPTPPGSWHLPE